MLVVRSRSQTRQAQVIGLVFYKRHIYQRSPARAANARGWPRRLADARTRGPLPLLSSIYARAHPSCASPSFHFPPTHSAAPHGRMRRANFPVELAPLFIIFSHLYKYQIPSSRTADARGN